MRLALLTLLAALAACATESVSERTCTRADTCNVLATSVKECVETIDTALGQLTPTQADEFEFAMDMCLEHPSCDGFSGCFSNLLSTGGSSSPTGGGNPPPAPPPPGGP